MTDLWTRFQAAVRWLVEGEFSAINVVQGAPVSSLVDYVTTEVPTTAPLTVEDGVDVRGVRTVDLAAEFGVAGSTAVIRLYVYNGAWYSSDEDFTITALEGESRVFLDPFDVESWQRMYVRVIEAPPSGTITVRGCPEAT